MPLNSDTMDLEIINPVGPYVSSGDHQHPSDPGVVNEFGAHQTWLTCDQQPGPPSRDSVGGRVADDVHLGMVTPDLHPNPRDDLQLVS